MTRTRAIDTEMHSIQCGFDCAKAQRRKHSVLTSRMGSKIGLPRSYPRTRTHGAAARSVRVAQADSKPSSARWTTPGLGSSTQSCDASASPVWARAWLNRHSELRISLCLTRLPAAAQSCDQTDGGTWVPSSLGCTGRLSSVPPQIRPCGIPTSFCRTFGSAYSKLSQRTLQNVKTWRDLSGS